MNEPQENTAATAPLSDAQRSVWVAQRLAPGTPIYHECALWRIDGPLDVAALEAALQAAVDRQPTLRTRFPQRAGEAPFQQVDATSRVAFERVPLAVTPGHERDLLVAAALEHAARPFDLAAAAPVRWTLFELGPRRHALLRVWHHLISDGLSSRVLNDDVASAYAAAAAGRATGLAPVAADYLTFARRQQDPAARAALASHVEAWKARLAEAPTLALPTDFPRPAARTLRGAVVAARLPRSSADALMLAARSARTSPFVMFLTAYAALLSRLSGDVDLVVGTPVGGRPGPAYADVVGFFATMVACRLDLSGAPGAREAASRAHHRVRDAIEHHEVPLEMLVEALGLQRDASRQPLFQVAFGFRRKNLADLALEGLEVDFIPVQMGHARFDLTLSVAPDDDGADMHVNYALDLFERTTVERMARQYAALVEAMGREPNRPLSQLPLMDEATRARVVDGGCGPRTPVDGEHVVHRRFAALARQRPDACAIGTLTYAGLDAASSRLAVELRQRGAGPGRFVAVARERPADIAVAWLAVLKAGAAYLPVDPELPDARIGHMLDDAHVALAVADDAVAARLARPGLEVVRPEADAARIAAHPSVPPDDATGDGDAAYAIYTSGSTGRPKGVVVPHRAIVGLVCGADYAPIGPDDVVAQLAPPTFDASTFEFWGPLLNGASMLPIAKATALAPRALAAALAAGRVTTMFLTTALFDAVAREKADAFGVCRTVLFGGEAVDPRCVADVLRAGPPQRLVHVYGPTETTTFATWHEVRSVDDRAITVPIGKAIAHAEAYVLRDDGEPCAPGEPGEIVIGGTGVASGYLGGTEDDARRFVVASVGGRPPQRLYRTGDRARLRDDGAIDFLGRRDGQVKVRGHRIELDEVEAAIRRQPGVRDAVAVLRGETSDTRRIVAYIVPSNPAAPPPDGLRRGLRQALPPAMLPADIVWIPSLPLTSSGKVDRKALPAVDGTTAVVASGIRVPARDPLEAELLTYWERALGKSGIGIFDRFFDHGGNSLLAARMVEDYERETRIRLPLTTLFVDDTVAGVAQAIRKGALAAYADVVAVNGEGPRPPFVFVHGDFNTGGFHSHTLARMLGTDQPFYAVHPHGVADGTVPESIEAMAAERVQALRQLRPRGPYVLCGHCNGGYVAFEMARQLLAGGEAVSSVIIVDATAPGTSGRLLDATGIGEEFARFGGHAPTDRASDIGQRLQRAMRAYRAAPIDVHVVLVRAALSPRADHDAHWAALGSTAEVRVLAGDHRSLILEEGGEPFVAVLRDVIDRAALARA